MNRRELEWCQRAWVYPPYRFADFPSKNSRGLEDLSHAYS